MNDIRSLEVPVMSFAEVCDRGKEREENQDSVRHVRLALGELLLVADGIGGYVGGATASRMVIEGFTESMAANSADDSPEQAIREAAAHTNRNIYEAANAPDSIYRRMGSTVVLALLIQKETGTSAWIGHIGDSRAYLIRDGRMSRVTNDHSAVQALLDSHVITPEQASTHPDASVLTRSLGHRPEVEIEISIVSMIPGDTLLLCSDGLWGYVPELQIESIAVNSNGSLEEVAQGLFELAMAAGGHDNIGVEMVRLNRSTAQTQILSV
jgi:serine/threonine protein phosphatase PrpC